jgi:hypothetical protein
VPTITGAMVGVVQRRNQRRNSGGRSEVSSPQTSQLRQATEVIFFFLGDGAKFHNLTKIVFLSRLPEPEDVVFLYCLQQFGSQIVACHTIQHG